MLFPGIWVLNHKMLFSSQIASPIVSSPCRPSMSGLHLAKRSREHRKMDLQRDFTVASPAEFIARFGGTRVIEKVSACFCHAWLLLRVHPWAASIWSCHPLGFTLPWKPCTAVPWCFQLLCSHACSSDAPGPAGPDCQQWHCCCQMHAFHPPLGLRDVPK